MHFDNPKAIIAIRSDGYIGMFTGSIDQNAVKEYLEKILPLIHH
jgi:hypothetical protein